MTNETEKKEKERIEEEEVSDLAAQVPLPDYRAYAARGVPAHRVGAALGARGARPARRAQDAGPLWTHRVKIVEIALQLQDDTRSAS